MGDRKSPQGTYIERSLFESKAFLSLRGFAPQLLILLLGKRWFDKVGKRGHERRICTNCDSLTFTYVEAEKKYGVTKPTLTRAFDKLLARGFLTIKHQGGGYKQDKTIYGLTENWMLWRPGVVFEKRERDSVQRGFRKPKRKVKGDKDQVVRVDFKKK
jgi:hypothetical protein